MVMGVFQSILGLQQRRQAGAQLGGQVPRTIAFNPFTLALRLNGFEVQENDQTPIIGFEEFVVNVRATTLFLQTLGFDEIRLVMPFVAGCSLQQRLDQDGSPIQGPKSKGRVED